MAVPSLKSSNVVLDEHVGWKLQARWFYSFGPASEGWVCFVSAPGSEHKLNIGRWKSSDEALERGRSYVNRAIQTKELTKGKGKARAPGAAWRLR